MKKIALLGLLFLSQLSFSQKAQNFESKITFQKTNPEGCLNFYYGPFPEETFTPECRGREEQIFTASRYNTYSNVNVSAGVAYTFITYSEYNSLKKGFHNNFQRRRNRSVCFRNGQNNLDFNKR